MKSVRYSKDEQLLAAWIATAATPLIVSILTAIFLFTTDFDTTSNPGISFISSIIFAFPFSFPIAAITAGASTLMIALPAAHFMLKDAQRDQHRTLTYYMLVALILGSWPIFFFGLTSALIFIPTAIVVGLVFGLSNKRVIRQALAQRT